LGYTDDEIFARNWARSRAEDHGYGPLKIARELGARGIEEPIIRGVIRETFSRYDESEMARQVLGKKFRGAKLDDPKTLRRAASFLQRCGYNETVILSVLRQYED
jgi:SOS response regulatory protein OraA/RecX